MDTGLTWTTSTLERAINTLTVVDASDIVTKRINLIESIIRLNETHL